MESGTPQREYECSMGFVLFVIGRCTQLGMLNSVFHLLDHDCIVGSGRIGGCCYLFQILFAIDDAVISKEPYWRLNVFVYVVYV